MAKTVIAIYDDVAAAYSSIKELINQGFISKDISILVNENITPHKEFKTVLSDVVQGTVPGIGKVITAGPLAQMLHASGEDGSILKSLMDLGLPDDAAQSYAEGVRRGGALVSLSVEDAAADQARGFLDLHRPVDMKQRSRQWREEGWAGYDALAAPYSRRAHPAPVASPAENDWEAPSSQEVMVAFSDFNTYEADFRNHFATTMLGSGYTYEQYQPAYRFGYHLATNQQNYTRDWKEIEQEARQHWDQRSPGTWEAIKTAVHYAWNEIHDAQH